MGAHVSPTRMRLKWWWVVAMSAGLVYSMGAQAGKAEKHEKSSWKESSLWHLPAASSP